MRLRALCLVVAIGCGEGDPGTTALFAIPGGVPGDDFYATPFPNDLWRKSDGTLDLSQFPTNALLVDNYRVAAETLDGFGKNAAIFARFSGPLDPTSLPDAAGSTTDDASVYVVDVDPDSDTFGVKSPVIVRFRAENTQTIGKNNLVVRPYPGFPLADATTYALIVTDRIRDAAGSSVSPSTELSELLGEGGDQLIVDAREVYTPLLDYLDEPGGDERENIVSATVFTTQSALSIVPALRKAVFATAEPVATDVTNTATNATFKTFTGSYQAPNFQAGDAPYKKAPDGEIRLGSDGMAVVQRTETMRFALTVPAGDPPAGGFPICIYSHGTGGDFQSFIGDGTALSLARQGIAVISTDQVLHGPRNPGGNEELDFFNFQNPYAIRDNSLQGSADAWSQMRLALGMSIVEPVNAGGRTITFDGTKLSFFGHSQGGLTGPGFVTFEPTLSGAVFSGTGGVTYLGLLYKTEPLDIPALLGAVVRDEPLDEDNPSLAMAEMFVERTDPVNYAALMVRKPPIIDGVQLAPRNIYQLEGFTDSFTPNLAIEAFATAIGGNVVMTPDTAPVPGLELEGRTVLAPPFQDNLDGATATLAQYKQQPGSDGHFVVFDIPAAERQAAEFLGSLARTGTATVVAPN